MLWLLLLLLSKQPLLTALTVDVPHVATKLCTRQHNAYRNACY